MDSLTPSLPRQVTFGAEREKLVKLLGSTLSDSRFSTVARILVKDPTVALEPIMFDGAKSPFVVSCIAAGYLHGLDVAKSCGLDISGYFGTSTLLDHAISKRDVAAVAHLIHLGADVNRFFDDASKPGAPPLSRALQNCVTLDPAWEGDFRIPRVLMDAGASPVFPAHVETAAHTITCISWTSPTSSARAAKLAKLLGEVKSRGASMDSNSSKRTMAPLRLALGAKNVDAALALIHLGAAIDEKTLGVDIIQMAINNKLDAHVPAIQTAMMQRTSMDAQAAVKAAADSARAAVAAGSAAATADDPQPLRNRRHMPSM